MFNMIIKHTVREHNFIPSENNEIFWALSDGNLHFLNKSSILPAKSRFGLLFCGNGSGSPSGSTHTDLHIWGGFGNLVANKYHINVLNVFYVHYTTLLPKYSINLQDSSYSHVFIMYQSFLETMFSQNICFQWYHIHKIHTKSPYHWTPVQHYYPVRISRPLQPV